MTGIRRARTGRGWDAAPPRAERRPRRDLAGRGSDPHPPDLAAAPTDPPPTDRPRSTADPSAPRTGRPRSTADPSERAREICLRQLAVRPRTRLELATAMRRQGVADEVAAEVLDRYGEVGIIDDEAFARAWVTSRHHGKGLARRALAGELRRKGVDADAVDVALGELGADTEARTARALIDRKLRGERLDQPEAVLRRLVGLLARKGYQPGLAFRVVKEALAERDIGEADDFDPDLLEATALDAEALTAETADRDG